MDLISLFKESGNKDCIGELFRRYGHLVLGVCMKYLKDEDESKDALMEVFEKLPEDLRKHEISNFRAWLHQVARNHCLMKLRSQSSLLSKNVEMAKDLEVIMELPTEIHLHGVSEKEQELRKMEAAIMELKEEQRICIELFYLQEKSYVEVAQQTGYDLNKVKSCIQNGKRNIMLIMTGKK
ncbi:MAG: sigma-70 family RNA polymerase sigma factor [Bacteroidota bacterium]